MKLDAKERQYFYDMAALNDEEREPLKRALKASLLKKGELPHVIEALFEEAVRTRDGNAIEFALMTAFVFGVPRSLVAPLRELVSADWHERHEDVVSLLDEMRDPDSVDAFRDAATVIPAYLEFDDARALAVKAMWALGNLGTERAKAALRDLARSNEAVIQENAVKQLARLGEA